ncbi:MAG: polynucleotide adenylyltransferase PcnB [Gammaproteobacteria bacterium]|nr:polynucleotide adenylyltransferase PcnB [Gammaproteobacteria bacterium]
MKPVRQTIRFDKQLLDKDSLKVVSVLTKAGFEAYLVGGCIRDLLLDYKPKDFDIATSATPEQAHKLFKRSRLIGRRFRLLHVMFSPRKFLEVATFRAGKVQTAKNGTIFRDNLYGSLEEDAFRRDFTVNALYYDVAKSELIDYVGGLKDLEAGQIEMIGDPIERFEEDPVRMIRAVRFQVKLGAQLSQEILSAIKKQASLLANIPPSRLFDECIKLFHNEKGLEVFKQLDKIGLLKQLFRQTENTSFIEQALINTSERIKAGKSVTPAFLFAVFLWQAQNKRFEQLSKKKKSRFLLMSQASDEVVKKQVEQVMMPKWLSARVRDTWLMQHKLENCQPKNEKEMIAHPRFRMAYDFLVLRSESINPELKERADRWTQLQK